MPFSKTKKKATGKNVHSKTEKECEHYAHSAEKELAVMVVASNQQQADDELLKCYLEMESLSTEKINEQDSLGMTALHFAVAMKNLKAVNLLLSHRANANIRDSLGFTPLFQATGRYPSVEIATCLLELGKASLHIATETGAFPLHGAALQGNVDCVRLLLKHGADPRRVDHDGTTAADLAKDDATRAAIHKAGRKDDKERDRAASLCAYCGNSPDEGLKRCAQCHVTMYCNKDCQRAHWKADHKKNCTGYVIAESQFKLDNGKEGYTCTLSNVLGAIKPQVRVRTAGPHQSKEAVEHLQGKQFVVKVQVPMDGSGPMMVYNEDRTLQGWIHPTAKGYDNLFRKVQMDGNNGLKAFFWAELDKNTEGNFKIYPGKCAPFQAW